MSPGNKQRPTEGGRNVHSSQKVARRRRREEGDDAHQEGHTNQFQHDLSNEKFGTLFDRLYERVVVSTDDKLRISYKPKHYCPISPGCKRLSEILPSTFDVLPSNEVDWDKIRKILRNHQKQHLEERKGHEELD